jgi:hypothetical protein
MPFEETLDALRKALGQPDELRACPRLHPAERERAVGALNIHTFKEQQMNALFRDHDGNATLLFDCGLDGTTV